MLHAFPTQAKQDYRNSNLTFLQHHAWRLWEDEEKTRLACDWCELLGQTGDRTYKQLTQTGTIQNHQFIGVDTNQQIVQAYRQKGIKAIVGDLTAQLHTPAFAKVGVLNFDGYLAVDSSKLRSELLPVKSLARIAVDTYGEFALLLNCDLQAARRHQHKTGEALRRHAIKIARVFNGIPSHNSVDPDILLPDEAQYAVEHGELGDQGCFYLYQSQPGRSHTMAALQLILA